MRTRVLVAALLTLAACGRGPEDFEVGIKRVALALAFAEEELAEPVQPNVIRQLIPAPPSIDLSSPPPLTAIDFGFENPLDCPAGAEGAAPAQAVSRTVTAPPEVGTYLRHNTGKVEVTGGVVPITLPFPPITRWEVPQIELEPRELGPFNGTPADTTPPGDNFVLDLRKVLVEGTFVVTDRIRITHAAIELLTRTTEVNGETTVFTPDPPITLYQYGVEGTVWRSAGMDTETDTAMLVQGTIERREVVDVCGVPIDTYRVSVIESSVNLETGETSGTTPDRPNVYNVAPHHGGLVIREDVRSTTRARDPESGSPVTVLFEYVSTINDVEPVTL